MAKDSTAVRKLIELAQQKPIDVDLGELFESEPPKRAPLPPPRTTGMQPSAAPPPLPRSRVPAATQNALSAITGAPPSSADVAHGTPAPQRIEHAADEVFGAKPMPPLPVAGPGVPPPPKAPPPRRATATRPPPVAAAPAPTPRPAPLPVAPPPPAPDDDEGSWFDQSEQPMDDYLIGTQTVERSRGSAVVAIAAAFGLGLAAAGGYLAYDHLGKADAKTPTATASAAPAAAAVSPSIKAAELAAVPQKAAEQAVAQVTQTVSSDPPAAGSAAPAAEAAAPSPAAASTDTAPAAPTPPTPTVQPIEPAPAAAAPATAPTVAAVAPSAAPAPSPAASAPVAGAMIDVVLKSEPEAVTVMLIDGGGAVKLGKTPTTVSLSAGTQHQILFSRDGYTATMATIDPAAQTDVMVALAPTPGAAQRTAELASAAPAERAPAHASSKHASSPAAEHANEKADKSDKTAKTDKVAKTEKSGKSETPTKAKAEKVADKADRSDGEKTHTAAAKRTATAAASSAGTLMIGAKPPCEIIVDGRATGLTTPQRSIALPAGSHSVTLVNKANNIKKTFSVSITAGTPTKVVKDFTSMMKQ